MLIDTEIANSPVNGRHADGNTLGEVLGPGPTLLVFLRHLG